MKSRLLIMLMVIVAVIQGAAWGDFFTLGLPGIPVSPGESLTVPNGSSITYTTGDLYDDSSVDIQSGGSVDLLTAYDYSNVVLSGGSVNDLYLYNTSGATLNSGSVGQLFADNESRVMISGGSVGYLSAYNSSDVVLSGGSVFSLFARGDSTGNSTVTISGGAVTDYLGAFGASKFELTGGEIAYLEAAESSETTFHGYGWSATGSTLSIVGDQILGIGTLSGFWGDGLGWSTNIGYHEASAMISLVTVPVPVPGSLLLGAMGIGTSGMIWFRRRMGWRFA